MLDTTVTPELAAEGLARDLVRVVQQARRDAGFDVSDRILLTVAAPGHVIAAVRAHERYVSEETLAREIAFDAVRAGFSGTLGDGTSVTVAVVADSMAFGQGGVSSDPEMSPNSAKSEGRGMKPEHGARGG